MCLCVSAGFVDHSGISFGKLMLKVFLDPCLSCDAFTVEAINPGMSTA